MDAPKVPKGRGPQKAIEPSNATEVDRVVRVADAYRALVRLIGVQVALSVVGRVVSVPARRSDDTIATVVLLLAALVGLVLVAASAVKGYQLAAALESSSPALWAVGFLLPCLSLVLLLVMSVRASRLCRAYGIRVGMLGPVGDSVDALAAKHKPR